MPGNPSDTSEVSRIAIAPDVMDYIAKRDCDFRVCTSCGGPILLPVRVKPPKKSDLLIEAAHHTIYVSIHQARYLDEIRSDMIPFYEDDLAGYGQR
ncbi:hypothetical protein [Methanoregula sp.]|jgi:hypothetical protein|uniref:hypothetical protein n=1 Tax=Methanoregula sp. TaxID=2052170 RepID=UPI003569C9CA